MKISDLQDDGLRTAADQVLRLFESLVGASSIESGVEQVGTQMFLKLVVGRTAPIYDFALQELRNRIEPENPFHGLIRIITDPGDRFPASVEASALAMLLARATRPVSQGARPEGFIIPYVPFQNREDHRVAQPATQLIVGRRGVGKSTLVMRAQELLLAGGKDLSATLDMQAYSELTGAALHTEVLIDVLRSIREAAIGFGIRSGKQIGLTSLDSAMSKLESEHVDIERSVPRLRRALGDVSKVTGGQIYLFLDDFHLIDQQAQPQLLQLLHGVVKGANGWLKVAGLRSLLNYYDPVSRKGLQVPGDAQLVSLDLTLENPQAAEQHLSAILGTFMSAVGYSSHGSVLPRAAFRRLVWANAGVPRDFLQMFARSLEHASKARNASVTLGDVNIAIGEFGQRKLDEMQEDARNEQGVLRRVVEYLLDFCLQDREPRVNAFLVRAADSKERSVILTLSDLRLVHLIHQSITPNRAGETYQAYILDYALFTGFRRKRNVKEMLPDEGEQFKASALRQLPKLPDDFLSRIGADEPDEELETDAQNDETAPVASKPPLKGPARSRKKAVAHGTGRKSASKQR
jgi:hypothetical protein